MTRELVVLSPESTIADATRLMASHRVRHLPIVDKKTGHLVGMVSGTELLLATEPGVNPLSPRAADVASRRHVKDVMAPASISVRSDAPIEEAARILRDRKLGALPVVDQGTLVGILTDHDLLRAFMEFTGADEPGCEVTLELTEEAGAVARMAELGRRHGLQIGSVVSFQHERRRLGVVRLLGAPSEAFLDDVWRSDRVLRVRCHVQPAGTP
ncbi:MAG: CBS domain-containing protein [Planctomycetota bacterium]